MQEITSRNNPICVHLKKLGTSKSYRDEHGEFLCDGFKLLEEAVSVGAQIKTVLSTVDINIKLPAETHVYKAQKSLINSLSPLKNAQDVIFTCCCGEYNDFVYQ
ncbi:MAG: hypothetical protein LBD23_16230, partial [Oscillospiraceae bacterium]|nr:hypothetical protein [Oscillospiraceae bacterium]